MGADAAAFVGDRVKMAVEADDFGADADLLHKLASDRFSEGLADFDHAAGQAEMADERRSRPPNDQNPAVSEYRCRYGEDRAGGEQSVIHPAHLSRACRGPTANPNAAPITTMLRAGPKAAAAAAGEPFARGAPGINEILPRFFFRKNESRATLPLVAIHAGGWRGDDRFASPWPSRALDQLLALV
jgi:hypothetical protein